MGIFKKCSENYVNWVIKLGKIRSAILGFVVLATSAILLQFFLDYLFLGKAQAIDILRSVLFGLISAPFVIYFFNVIVEKLEKSRIKLEQSVYELGQLREQDFVLNKRLEKNSQDKTALMATISHELRTPLNGIIGLSRILLEENVTSEQQQAYLKTINMSAMSLSNIFSDIIDLEKIDSKRIELFNKPVELMQFITDINHFAKLMADKKAIKFHLNYAKNLPDHIYTDNARLSQILWNLLSNAVKFTPEGGEIWLDIQAPNPPYLTFSVKDTGFGIDKTEQEKIFQMFYQSENSNGHKAQGSGIGLAVAKQIAQLMQGDLTVQSELGQGSTFTLTIKADAVDAHQHIQPWHLGLEVLLVEDVEVNVIVAKAMLEKFGCKVDVAMTGAEAFQKFEQNSYDLILLDIQLPDTTGTAIAQELHRRYEADEIDYLPLMVALTANIMQTKEDYQQQGMDDVLRKPLSIEALSTCLKAYFGEAVLQNVDEILPLVKEPDNEIAQENVPYDAKMVQELLSVMGKQGVLASVTLFEQLMPDYVQKLGQDYQQWQQQGSAENRKKVADQAHKIKGALASIGLSRLQEVAQQAQTDNGEEWASQISGWIAQIQQEWQADLNVLKQQMIE